jgi:hypothetical protein
VADEEKTAREARKYREPKPGTMAAETIAMFRKAGIECNLIDHAPDTHIITFFGAVPEESASDA